MLWMTKNFQESENVCVKLVELETTWILFEENQQVTWEMARKDSNNDEYIVKLVTNKLYFTKTKIIHDSTQ